jgi:hypothetical protein
MKSWWLTQKIVCWRAFILLRQHALTIAFWLISVGVASIFLLVLWQMAVEHLMVMRYLGTVHWLLAALVGWLFAEFALAVLSHLLRLAPGLETLEMAFMLAIDRLLPMFFLRFLVFALAMVAGVFLLLPGLLCYAVWSYAPLLKLWRQDDVHTLFQSMIKLTRYHFWFLSGLLSPWVALVLLFSLMVVMSVILQQQPAVTAVWYALSLLTVVWWRAVQSAVWDYAILPRMSRS